MTALIEFVRTRLNQGFVQQLWDCSLGHYTCHVCISTHGKPMHIIPILYIASQFSQCLVYCEIFHLGKV